MAVASLAGRALISGLPAAGNTIFWAASWLCTSVLTTECPHSSSPPPIARTAASTRPAMVAIASNVRLRISGASLHRSGPPARRQSFVEQSTASLFSGQDGRAARPQLMDLLALRDLAFLPGCDLRDSGPGS